MPSELPFHLLNAFVLPTSPYSGNQASIVLLPAASHERAQDEKYMQLVARDFNLSETAYIYPLPENTEDVLAYSLRWFTPDNEVELCGHATLASANILFSLNPKAREIRFATRYSGELVAKRVSDDGDIEIILPITKLDNSRTLDEAGIRDALGLNEQEVVIIQGTEGEGGGFVVEVKEDVDIRRLTPDFKALIGYAKGLIIATQIKASESTEKLVIKSRVFVPGVGVPEDPVTGSAHSLLTGYYLTGPPSSRLPSSLTKSGKSVTDIEIDAEQSSVRGGALQCRLVDGRAKIVGKAVEMAQGNVRA